MGSKSRFLATICPVILGEAGADKVVDLFAGSGSVGYALSDHAVVYANDVQRYAYVINDAILNGCALDDDAIRSVVSRAEEIQSTLAAMLQHSVELERNHLANPVHAAYSEYCAATPSVTHPQSGQSGMADLSELVALVLQSKTSMSPLDLPLLFTAYYPNTYFGLSQCIQIDAMRAAASELEDRRQEGVVLTALMAAMSTAVSATTHFAQYLKPNSQRNTAFLASKRSLDVVRLTQDVLRGYGDRGLLHSGEPRHYVGNMDYLDYLKTVDLGCRDVVYADPPYFKEHYSRYYHLLETLVLYDYPQITFNPRLDAFTVGRYRAERFTSPFGRKSTALSAFKSLADACSTSGCRLAISYSKNSIVAVDDIIQVVGDRFSVATHTIAASHSTQGRKTQKAVTEVLLVCEPSKKSAGHFTQMPALKKALLPIEPDFATPLTGLHPYTARKPLNVLSEVVGSLLPEKGVVLDPFAGSGTTLVEASKLGHDVIGIDISELSNLLCRATLEPWSADATTTIFEEFMDTLESRVANLYSYESNDGIRVIERCHFDRTGGGLIPRHYWYRKHIGDGKWSARLHDDASPRFVQEYSQLEAGAESSRLEQLHLIPNSRIAIPAGAVVGDFFCARNKRFLDLALESATEADGTIAPQLQLLLSSCVSLLRLSDKKASSQLPFWIPNTDATSRNGMAVLRKRASQVTGALRHLEASYGGSTARGTYVLHKSPLQSLEVERLPDESVDLVVTDPPYTDQVPYLEYAQLSALILGWDSTDASLLQQEIVVSDAATRPDKTRESFGAQLSIAIHRISRAMKQDAYMALFFHDFSLSAWADLIQSCRDAGLSYEGQLSINRNRRSFKSILSPQRTLNGEYLVVFRKGIDRAIAYDGDLDVARRRCCNMALEVVKANGGAATSQQLYDDGLLTDAVEHGYLWLLADKYGTFLDVVADGLEFHDDGLWRAV